MPGGGGGGGGRAPSKAAERGNGKQRREGALKVEMVLGLFDVVGEAMNHEKGRSFGCEWSVFGGTQCVRQEEEEDEK